MFVYQVCVFQADWKTTMTTKGETITRVNGNISFLLVNVYKISKRVNEVH